MERETLTIKTPVSGIEIVLKAYLTGLEKRLITNAGLPATVDFDVEDGVRGLSPVQIMNATEDASIRNVIVSIGENKEGDFVEMVLNMRSQDADFVVKKIKEIVEGLTEEKKTT